MNARNSTIKGVLLKLPAPLKIKFETAKMMNAGMENNMIRFATLTWYK